MCIGLHKSEVIGWCWDLDFCIKGALLDFSISDFKYEKFRPVVNCMVNMIFFSVVLGMKSPVLVVNCRVNLLYIWRVFITYHFYSRFWKLYLLCMIFIREEPYWLFTIWILSMEKPGYYYCVLDIKSRICYL